MRDIDRKPLGIVFSVDSIMGNDEMEVHEVFRRHERKRQAKSVGQPGNRLIVRVSFQPAHASLQGITVFSAHHQQTIAHLP